MKLGVIEFPGSDCEELKESLGRIFKYDVVSIWHDEEYFEEPDVLILPGGSSFGDYLRPGALAKASR